MANRAKMYRVRFDRPPGLSSDGYSALVRLEPGPIGLREIAAASKRWHSGAEVRTWDSHSYLIGRMSNVGALKRASSLHEETRKYKFPRVAKARADSWVVWLENRRRQKQRKAPVRSGEHCSKCNGPHRYKHGKA